MVRITFCFVMASKFTSVDKSSIPPHHAMLYPVYHVRHIQVGRTM